MLYSVIDKITRALKSEKGKIILGLTAAFAAVAVIVALCVLAGSSKEEEEGLSARFTVEEYSDEAVNRGTQSLVCFSRSVISISTNGSVDGRKPLVMEDAEAYRKYILNYDNIKQQDPAPNWTERDWYKEGYMALAYSHKWYDKGLLQAATGAVMDDEGNIYITVCGYESDPTIAYNRPLSDAKQITSLIFLKTEDLESANSVHILYKPAP